MHVEVSQSDNGTNFVGADRDLRKAAQSLLSDETIDSILRQSKFHSIEWKFSPSSAPHFAGLWEAGVHSMKGLLRKMVKPHSLSFEELTPLLTEATLNSRPLLTSDSLPPDEVPILTPGHF